MSKEATERNNMWKWLILLLITAGSVYLAYPPKDKIRLGLDLKGGNSFTLGVDYARLHDKIIESKPECEKDSALMEAEVARRLDGADDRMIEIIRRRVDSMGTNEPVIQSVKGKHQIVVQLPGADKKTGDEARERLQKMAYLEFRFVPENERELLDAIPAGACPPGFVESGSGYAKAKNWKEISAQSNYLARVSSFGTTDSHVRFILEPAKDKLGNFSGEYLPRFVERRVQLTGESLASATPDSVQTLAGGYCVAFELKREAARKFATLTREHVGRQLAIILDDELVSSPVIQSEIGRNGQITGNFTLDEAKRLAADLNAGALPAPLKIDAETKVDPTVGQDAIDSGITAAAIGFALVAIFMMFYYWQIGFVADIALFLDVILLPAALFLVAHALGVFVEDPSMAGGGAVQLPVLTMPGIAGLVLTLGMAVDANVLVFERIREEFQRGANVGKAVANGYARAFTAIFDSNITTIITGCILYSVGTGPVRGFAIMLTGGVVISMFTAVVVTRIVIDAKSNPASTKPFKMLQFFKNPKVDFMGVGGKTMTASAAIIAVSLAIFGYRLATNPGSVLAVDLTGGTSIVYGVENGKIDLNKVRKTLEPIDNAMVIQRQGDDLFIKTGITSDPGTTATFEIAKGAEKFNREAVSRALAAFDVNNTIRFEKKPAKIEGGATNQTAVLTVKVSENSASTKGVALAAAKTTVAAEIGRIVSARCKGMDLKLAKADETIGVETRIARALNAAGSPKFTVKSSETVGPTVGEDLRESGSKAVMLSLLAILLYVAFRFRFGFGLGGLVALAHDALISLGLFSLCGRQVSLIVITALLTIIGYSINDTVVVFDRIRELLRRDPRASLKDVCNTAINECLGRTVITSLTTFFAVAALFIFGDGSIYDFALTMLIGVVAGTYSSIFIATPVMVAFYRGKRPDAGLSGEEDKKNG